MDLDTFQSLSRDDVAGLVRQAGPKVCVFPLKGTRRWVMLEHPEVSTEDFASAYLDATTRRSIELFQLIFDHGMETLLTPSFDMPAMERGEKYMNMAAEALASLATHPAFLDFYQAYQVRVRFYGDYRAAFQSTPYAYLLSLFDKITAQTMANNRHRLFFGLFAHDSSEAAAELAVHYYREHGNVPDRRTLVEMYYGEYVAPVDVFIGFGKLRAFDMPLLTTGKEDLYFTVSPSLYLTEPQLRDILYDHLYGRVRTKADLSPDRWAPMKEFYRTNVGKTMGIGIGNGDVWRPLPQVELPTEFM
ncbi:MAG: diterpene synthase [Anaerolineae bacterium]|nr:diterpene synthase [Anaerolineae bacterium]